MKLCLKALVWTGLFAIVVLPLFAAEASPGTNGTVPAPGKSYQIRNKEFGQLLRPENANNADGTAIVLYPAQTWKCMTWKFNAAGASQYCLQNHFTSKTFAAVGGAGDTRPVTQVPWKKEADQRPVWQITPLKDGTFKIVDAKTGDALTARKANGSDVAIVLAPWKDSANQKWELQEIDPAKLTM